MGRSWEIMKDSALRSKGHDWRNLIITLVTLRAVAPWVAVGAVLGVLGYLAHLAWEAITAPSPAPVGGDVPVTVSAGPAFSAVPAWLWVAAGVLLLALFWLFRPGRIVTPSRQRLRVAQVFAVVILFAGVVGFGLSNMTG